MATLKESLQKAAKNPNSNFARELRKRIESGSYNKLAQQEGIDFSGLVKQAPKVVPSPLTEATNVVGDFALGAAKEAGQRIASVPQNIAKVVSGATEAAIGIKP